MKKENAYKMLSLVSFTLAIVSFVIALRAQEDWDLIWLSVGIVSSVTYTNAQNIIELLYDTKS